MSFNRIGKFEGAKIVNDFDKALIELYGVNMTDAKITRVEVLHTVAETQCARKAAEALGVRRGMALVPTT